MLLNTFDNDDYESLKCDKCNGIVLMTRQYFEKLPKYIKFYFFIQKKKQKIILV